MQYWKSYKYKNITFFIVGILLTVFLYSNEYFHSYLLNLGSFGYLGGVVAGMLFISTFTVSVGALSLLVLAEQYSIFSLAIAAGVGGVIGDFLIFKFVRGGIMKEITPLYNHFGGNHVRHLFHSRYFSWTLPVIGALIIMSPLPDEVGVTLMGISKMKARNFILLSFVLNTIGIFLVLSASTVLKP